MTRTFKLMLLFSSFIAMQSSKAQPGKQQGEELKKKIDAVVDPYKHPTTKEGLYLEAKVDGKKWVADWMFVDPDPSGSIAVTGHKGDKAVINIWIGTNTIKEKGTKNFSELNQAQMVDDKGNIMTGSEGSYQITNVTDSWIEGTFHFTAKDIQSSGVTHQVTDGFFRQTMTPKLKKKLGL